MVGLQEAFADAQGASQQGLSFRPFPLLQVASREIVEADRGVKVVGPQPMLTNRQCSLIQWLGLCILSLLVVEESQSVQTGCQERMVRFHLLFIDGEGLQIQWLSLSIFSLLSVEVRQHEQAGSSAKLICLHELLLSSFMRRGSRPKDDYVGGACSAKMVICRNPPCS